MTLRYSLNNMYKVNDAFPGMQYTLFLLKEFLKSHGWTVPLSYGSNGGGYGSGDHIITYLDFGANSWIVLQTPTLGKQILIYRHASQIYSARVLWSPAVGFTGGGTGSLPTASDQKDVIGDATNGATAMYNSPSSFWGYHHFIMDDEPPYGFVTFGWGTMFGQATHAWFLDPIVPGTYDPSDPDPYVLHFSYGANGYGLATDLTNYSYVYSIPAVRGSVAGVWGCLPAMMYYTQVYQMLPQKLMPSPYTGKEPIAPIMYGKAANSNSSPAQYKGMSSLFRWIASYRSPGTRLNGGKKVAFGYVAAPWDSSVIPLG